MVKTIVKTMEFPGGKFASGASTIVQTRCRRKPRNGVLYTLDAFSSVIFEEVLSETFRLKKKIVISKN